MSWEGLDKVCDRGAAASGGQEAERAHAHSRRGNGLAARHGGWVVATLPPLVAGGEAVDLERMMRGLAWQSMAELPRESAGGVELFKNK